jgi:hypothetical protein
MVEDRRKPDAEWRQQLSDEEFTCCASTARNAPFRTP